MASKVKQWAKLGVKTEPTKSPADLKREAEEDAREDRASLQAFASACKAHAAATPADSPYRFGRSKVFIAKLDLHGRMKERLVEAHREGMVELSRLDLVPSLTKEQREICERSECHYLNATFHMIMT